MQYYNSLYENVYYRNIIYVLFYIFDEALYCLQSIPFIHIKMNDLYNQYHLQ